LISKLGSQSTLFDKLPNELLVLIWSVAYEDKMLSARPICRSLFPFQQAALYRNITISSLKSLSSLQDVLLEINPNLAALVTSLKIEIQNLLPRFDFPILNKLLFTLFNLESLELVEPCKPQHNLAEALSIGFVALPLLKTLNIQTSSTWSRPFDPIYYRFLLLFPVLETLTIRCDHGQNTTVRATRSSENGVGLSNSVRTLLVIGSSADHIQISRLCDRLTGLQHLHLALDSFSAPRYSSLLSSLPSDLLSLSLITNPKIPSSRGTCNELLPRFSSLQAVHLGRGTVDKHGLKDVLRQLSRLKLVIFGEGFSISQDRGRKYVDGTRRVQGLETVKFLGNAGVGGWEFTSS